MVWELNWKHGHLLFLGLLIDIKREKGEENKEEF